MNTRNKQQIEEDNRILKGNYGSRSKYLIEIAILEKWLIFDLSIFNNVPHIHNMTDLEACFDRQLANVGSILEEPIGIERAVIKLIAKVLLIFERHICMSYRISSRYYRGVKDEQRGIGQEYVLLINIMKITS